jgi:hypothetical protein
VLPSSLRRRLRLYFCLFSFDVGVATFAFLDLIILFAHIYLYIANTIRLFNQNMVFRLHSFNIYLLLLVLGLLPACKTTTADGKKRSKEISTLRLYLEVNSDGTPHNSGVAVYRGKPTMVNVNKEPILTEGDVQEAAVVEALGGFVIKIQFNRHGSLVLENTTTAYRGRRIAIQSQFGESRWLGAPLIASRITNGTYVFTPDASREEAERIVRGLNNVAAQIKKRSGF